MEIKKLPAKLLIPYLGKWDGISQLTGSQKEIQKKQSSL
jgi:hypothetical protein